LDGDGCLIEWKPHRAATRKNRTDCWPWIRNSSAIPG
jgi:hypothetical protein